MKQRILAILLTVALLLTFVPTAALADDTAEPAASSDAAADAAHEEENVESENNDSGPVFAYEDEPMLAVYTSGGFNYMLTSNNKAYIVSYSGTKSDLVIPDTIDSYPVITIGSSAFSGCTSLISVTIPDSVTVIDASAFYGCSNLTSVTIPDSVISIGGYAFSGCSSLSSVTIPDGIQKIGNYTFSGCSSLSSVVIPDSVTGIGMYAFDGCSSLASVTIGNSVVDIGARAFSQCSSLTSVTIPDSVINISDGAFWMCTGLTSVTIPDSVTNIDDDAFSTCSSLTSVMIPDSVSSIGSNAFANCGRLKSITIGNSVASIGGFTFLDCCALTSVIIGNGVTSIEDNAFIGCYRLADMYYTGTKAAWDAIEIGDSNSELTAATIHYHYGEDHSWLEGTKTAATCTADGYTTYNCQNCDETMTKTIPALGHVYSSVVTAPTCTARGYTTYTCSRCKYSYVSDYTDALGHDYADGFCTRCGCAEYDGTKTHEMPLITNADNTAKITTAGKIYYFSFTPETTHSYTFYSTGSADTYGYLYNSSYTQLTYNDDSGSGNNFKITYTLTAGTTYYFGVKYLSASSTGSIAVRLEPVHSYTAQVTAPTCTAQGYTTHTCSACGDSYVDSYTDALGHDLSATDNGDGTHTAACTRCDYRITEAHSYTSAVTAPTCTEKGYTTHTCSCGSSYTDRYTDPTGHTYQAAVTAPTCTAQGYTTHTCSACGDSYKDSYTDALGHNLSSRDNGDGTYTITCSRCDYSTTEAHSYTTEIVPPTCTEKGYTIHTCVCGDTYKDSYTDALGHDLSTRDNGDGTHTTTCSRCGYSVTDAHSYTSAVTAPTCTEQGYTTHTCSVCGAGYQDARTGALGHDLSIRDNGDGTHTTTCSRCGYSVTEAHSYVSGFCTCGKEQGTESGTCGDNLTWTLNKNGTLTISGTGDMYVYGYDGDTPWNAWLDSITTVVIENGVTSIGNCAFYKCHNLTDVSIPNSVTSIGTFAFDECTSLTSIAIPDSVTWAGNETFGGCTSLKSISLGSGIEGLGLWYFDGCTALQNITIPDSVTSFDTYTFRGCTSLTEITIPASVNGIGAGSFSGCTGLKQIIFEGDAPQFETGSAENDPAFNIFNGVTATVYYPGNNSTWTSKVMQQYGGNITWVPYGAASATGGQYLAHYLKNLTGHKISDTETQYSNSGDILKYVSAISLDESSHMLLFVLTVYKNGEKQFLIGMSYDYTTGTVDDSEVEAKYYTEHVDAAYAPINMTTMTSDTVPSFTLHAESGYSSYVNAGKTYIASTLGSGARLAFAQWTLLLMNRAKINLYNLGFTAYDTHLYTTPSSSHIWNAGTVTTAAKCTVDGFKTCTCTFCGATKTETVAATGHTWNSGKLTTPMTDTQNGVVTYTCKACGAIKTTMLPAGGSPFVDVQKTGDYFYTPVLWAVDQGITSGTSTFTFSPNNTCTRGQVVTFLWRAAGKPTVSGTNPFVDVKKSDYYYDAVLWAVSKGITNGTDKTHFSPNAKCTRGQVVTFMYRASGNPAVGSAANPFADVKTSDYFYKAVLWAVDQGITKGTSTTKFSPNTTCTRGQVVTFLYRYLGNS